MPPNLSDRQIRVYIGPTEVPATSAIDAVAQLDRLASRVPQLARPLGHATVIGLRKAINRARSRRRR